MRVVSHFAIACGCGLVVWLGNSSSIAAEKAPAKKSSSEAPAGALIVVEGVHTKDRIGKFRAISILDPKTLAKLETFFPNYRKLPASDIAAGWEMSYRVYFEFPEGKAIRLSVSAGKEASWSIGRGDFDVVGNFDEFVKELDREEVAVGDEKPVESHAALKQVKALADEIQTAYAAKDLIQLILLTAKTNQIKSEIDAKLKGVPPLSAGDHVLHAIERLAELMKSSIGADAASLEKVAVSVGIFEVYMRRAQEKLDVYDGPSYRAAFEQLDKFYGEVNAARKAKDEMQLRKLADKVILVKIDVLKTVKGAPKGSAGNYIGQAARLLEELVLNSFGKDAATLEMASQIEETYQEYITRARKKLEIKK